MGWVVSAILALATAPSAVAATDSGDFAALVEHVERRAQLWREGAPINSLVLDERQTVLSPVAIGCERRPPVVIVDLDNADGPTPLTPPAAGSVKANDGWIAALAAIRTAEVGVVWVTGRPANEAGAIKLTLEMAGLDEMEAARLVASEAGWTRKQALRRGIAADSCVLAVVGDKRGDADEAYDYLRHPDNKLPIDRFWGEGWFLLPPPLATREVP
jgi:hypothetical protein